MSTCFHCSMFVIMTTCKRSERPEQPFLGQAEGGRIGVMEFKVFEKKGVSRSICVCFFLSRDWLAVRTIFWLMSLAITFLMLISWLLNSSFLTRSDQIEPWAWFFLRF